MLKKLLALTLAATFTFQTTGLVQAAPITRDCGAPGVSAFDTFRPAQLRSFMLDRNANRFDILLDKGDQRSLSDSQASETAAKLMEYFRIGVTLPNTVFWVNLRPDAPLNIIDPALEKTDLGKVFLETDLALKKDMALATSPATATGRKYWAKLYAKAQDLFGTKEIAIPTITRPWIVPGEIIIRQSADNAYVYKAALKVKVEQDYLKGASNASPSADPRLDQLNAYATQLAREIILPALDRKVNSSRAYAGFRQAFYSLVLAQWFKRTYKGTSAEYADQIDTRNLLGLTSKSHWAKEEFYSAYRKSFSQGEYNVTGNSATAGANRVRTYTSGGIQTGYIFTGETPVTKINDRNGFIAEGLITIDTRTGSIVENAVLDSGRSEVMALPAAVAEAKLIGQEPETYALPRTETVNIDAADKNRNKDGGVTRNVTFELAEALIKQLRNEILFGDRTGYERTVHNLRIIAVPGMMDYFAKLDARVQNSIPLALSWLDTLKPEENHLNWKPWIQIEGLDEAITNHYAAGWHYWRPEINAEEIIRGLISTRWQEKNKDGGDAKNVGGIDVSAMSIVTREGSSKATLKQGKNGGVSLKDLDRQWMEIRVEMAKGVKPFEKMKAFVEICSITPAAVKQLKKAAQAAMAMVQADEENGAETCEELKALIMELG